MAIPSRSRGRAAQAERARRTRARIVAAATALFTRQGYLQTTMAAIAAEAGVAYQTLYLSFGSKVALLGAAFDVAIAGDDDPVPALNREWAARLRDEPDGTAAVGLFIAEAARVFDREYPLYAAMKAAAADPEVADELARLRALRYQTYSATTATLAGKAGFTNTLSTEQASQLLYTVASEETYGLLVAEHGWSPTDWMSWATRATSAELYPADQCP